MAYVPGRNTATCSATSTSAPGASLATLAHVLPHHMYSVLGSRPAANVSAGGAAPPACDLATDGLPSGCSAVPPPVDAPAPCLSGELALLLCVLAVPYAGGAGAAAAAAACAGAAICHACAAAGDCQLSPASTVMLASPPEQFLATSRSGMRHMGACLKSCRTTAPLAAPLPAAPTTPADALAVPDEATRSASLTGCSGGLAVPVRSGKRVTPMRSELGTEQEAAPVGHADAGPTPSPTAAPCWSCFLAHCHTMNTSTGGSACMAAAPDPAPPACASNPPGAALLAAPWSAWPNRAELAACEGGMLSRPLLGGPYQ
mmetsp:Transcript_26632/g.67862  ORF Transcript_26632/g.67862 Transcript_26632/m.67862 type:complete len:316 (-) Transcript_26632:924-1871(-)